MSSDQQPLSPELAAAIGNLHHPDTATRVEAARQLAASGDSRAVEPLIQAIRSVTTDADQGVWAAQEALAAFGAIGLTATLAHSYDADDFIRSLFVNTLGGFEDERALARLLEVADDPGFLVRVRAAEAMARMGNGAFFDYLLAGFLDTHRSPRGRVTMGLALYHLHDPRAVEPLLAALRDRQSWVRSCAAFVLSAFQDPRSIEPLIRALKDRSFKVRCAAASALGRFPDARARHALQQAQSDRHIAVQRIVAEVLNKRPEGNA